MPALTRAAVTPHILRWMREEAELEPAELASKVGTSEERVLEWERGEQQPTVRQARLAAAACRRPFTILFLERPPTEKRPPQDFRRVPDADRAPISPNLVWHLRRARELADDAVELAHQAGLSPLLEAWSPPTATLGDDPEDIAISIRRWLGITFEHQSGWRDPYQALNEWRAAVERKGALLISMPRVSLEEARGFSIHTRPLPVIAYSTKDSPRGRIFTILHETAHVILGQDGICDLHGPAGTPGFDVEVFCNAIAAAALMPRADFLAHELVRQHPARPRKWSDDELRVLSRDFTTSMEAALRRLVSYERATKADYLAFRKRIADQEKEREEEGFADHGAQVLNSIGTTYARLAFLAYDNGNITLSELSSHIGTKLRHLDGIRERLARRPA